MTELSCSLCTTTGGAIVFQAEKFRVIRAEEPGFPAFYRLVWSHHVVEFSDLNVDDQCLCMKAVNSVELALRAQLQPTKINLATLGNVVPHLHWHVIARFEWDTHFPAPVWGQAKRAPDTDLLRALSDKLKLAEQDMALRLGAVST